MIIDINSSKIKNDKRLSNLFVNANFNNLSINCNILKGNFYSDSFYYFPITENNKTFSSLFTRDINNTSHFYSQEFFEVQKSKIFKDIKEIDGFLIGGASKSSKKFIDIIKNYYR